MGQTDRETGVTARSTGAHLADRHGEAYCALGFAFGGGSFQAVTELPDEEGYALQELTLDGPLPDTIDATLATLGDRVALVDVRRASADDRLSAWLATPRRHFSAGATYEPGHPEDYITEYVYADAFDGICYVDETTRARPIGK